MLLPILILQRDVNKYLNNPANLTNENGVIAWMCKFISGIFGQFDYSPVAVTTSGTINYSLNWLQRHPSPPDNGQYFYVFASHSQKRQQAFQQMTQGERQELLDQLKSDYGEILIDYFTTDKTLKEKIDKFINTIFYANIPVPQIIEIHMEVIDEFSKQLKLEGRSDEALMDYRLTLIDILAHLCEVYRSSISK
ncbi:KaiA family protein [Nostoc linckia z18]|jgi:circadian clock protein KaiA|uniref:Circadian clock oscillator protein KaiA n=2 Tax=Nostoc linckia TaxID=92942 RepID=A0A9Q6ELL7_NOSLI|nr:KaiA family protein [Nostoc linckia]PHK31164.1 KaiA family protein [Nostoc linckia z15]PHK41287.1 KaiA family protein [Nostoc linckia z16]PHJ55811.1 KaiA family protein [Nostoc linckia z1]PHJ57331.1 KaiA family protein [Nostoc linckia z3]PHJ73998.1 KaiA family protein [Nostoc linckia z4]